MFKRLQYISLWILLISTRGFAQRQLSEGILQTSSSLINILLFVIIIVFVGNSIYFQYYKHKNRHARIDRFLYNVERRTRKGYERENKKEARNIKRNIPEKHVRSILEGLTKFEEEKRFLSKGISAQLLAEDMATNVKYLSKVINTHKNKTFPNYLNELRIKYVVERIQKEQRIRKYTIKAIAEELGYHNTETFSKAFYKYTGQKPSNYIKEMETK